MKIIMARTFQQAREYAIANRMQYKEWRFPVHPESLQGLEFAHSDVVYLDGWAHGRTPDEVEQFVQVIAIGARL